MILRVEMFTVICDNCGKDSAEGAEHSCWNEASTARELASECGWIVENDKDYCNNCWQYGDKDEIVITNP